MFYGRWLRAYLGGADFSRRGPSPVFANPLRYATQTTKMADRAIDWLIEWLIEDARRRPISQYRGASRVFCACDGFPKSLEMAVLLL